eukprot:2317928-Lingulodinium_polyedra.AAC.1
MHATRVKAYQDMFRQFPAVGSCTQTIVAQQGMLQALVPGARARQIGYRASTCAASCERLGIQLTRIQRDGRDRGVLMASVD